MNRILAVIPAYNEAEHIVQVIRAVLDHVPVLVVDDGSTDGTAALAASAGAEVLTQLPNQGKGAALRAGFRRALELGYDAVLTLDADGQHDPREIPKFLAAARGSADLIIGQRDFTRMPPVRRLANTLGQVLFSWALRQHVPDNQSGYRLLSRRLMETLLGNSETGFEFEVAMIATCVKKSFRLTWVPIRTIYAGESSHIDPVRHTLNFVRIAWATRRATRPSAMPPAAPVNGARWNNGAALNGRPSRR